MDRAVPTRPAERIVTLDIIRGFALLGILVVNMRSFSGVGRPVTAWDQAAFAFVNVFFDGKFNSLFSLLFAVGFTIQLDRLRQRAPGSAVWIYTRRLLVLFAIGVLHAGLIWEGDVLHMYALLGLFLLLVRNWSDRAVLALVAVCLLLPAARSVALLMFGTVEWTQAQIALRAAMVAGRDAAFGTGSYVDVVAQNLRVFEFSYSTTGYGLTATLVLGYGVFMTTMLLGLLAGRKGWIQHAAAHGDLIRRVQWWSLALGVGAGLVYAVAARFIEPFVPSVWFVVLRTAYSVSRVALMIFYIATIVRLSLNERWLRRLSSFADAGRMPLTNYLLQSLLCTFIFYGWGLGFWGQAGALVQLLLAFAIFFLIQVPLSRLWFRRFAYGPAEYAWRVLTYGQRPAADVAPQTIA